MSEVHEHTNNARPKTIKDEYFILTNDPFNYIVIDTHPCDSH